MVVFDASVWQGCLVYFTVAMTLTLINLSAAFFARAAEPNGFDSMEDLEQWEAWHEDENWLEAAAEETLNKTAKSYAQRRAG